MKWYTKDGSDWYEWAFPSYIPTLPLKTAVDPYAPTGWNMTRASDIDPAPRLPLETTWSNEKIVAYRTVTAVEDDGMWLSHYHPDGPSITTARHGSGETMTASCDVKCGLSPSMTCPSTAGDGCGWYAYKTIEAAYKARTTRKRVARVLLWGTVIEYTEGYRAQYLAVDKIYEIPVPEPVRGSADFGPGTIVSTKAIAAYNVAKYSGVFTAKMLSDLQTTITQVMNDPLVSSATADLATCGEPCFACHKACVRPSSLDHTDHYCTTGVQSAESMGVNLK